MQPGEHASAPAVHVLALYEARGSHGGAQLRSTELCQGNTTAFLKWDATKCKKLSGEHSESNHCIGLYCPNPGTEPRGPEHQSYYIPTFYHPSKCWNVVLSATVAAPQGCTAL